jgi:hypothetical protein
MTSLNMTIFCCKCVYMDNGRRGRCKTGFLKSPLDLWKTSKLKKK